MPAQSVKVLGFTFAVPANYAAGHVCTASEAEALNRLLVHGTAKALHKQLASALAAREANNAEELDGPQRQACQLEGLDRIASFALGFAQGHSKLAAIEVEARRIAQQALETWLNAQGKSIEDIPVSERATKLAQLTASPMIRESATRRVEEAQGLAARANEELRALAEGSSS